MQADENIRLGAARPERIEFGRAKRQAAAHVRHRRGTDADGARAALQLHLQFVARRPDIRQTEEGYREEPVITMKTPFLVEPGVERGEQRR